MFFVRIFLSAVLFLRICNALPYGSDLILKFYGSSNQLKINSKDAAPRGYISFENSFYKYHRDPQTWAKARQICEVEGGYLAIINSDDEASFLLGMMAKYPADVLTDVQSKDFVLLGFHDYFKDREFVTIDGKSMESSGYMHWAPGQPDNAGGNEHCGTLRRSGGLNDFPCETPSPFICEISAHTQFTINDVQNNEMIKSKFIQNAVYPQTLKPNN
ncbi:hemolymph lipopolysaccharide-binding protein-like [Chrysoperla carnea]|uniref:hemolymph lipopolysaccharide-binding protein-like n=1 Tax=Chrysoperla carnea TaxID=189513 RepID=UPI001D0670A2|nr:hemolymph lipopolysaccharide-binding protein-like [Chrysoperla carnea]